MRGDAPPCGQVAIRPRAVGEFRRRTEGAGGRFVPVAGTCGGRAIRGGRDNLGASALDNPLEGLSTTERKAHPVRSSPPCNRS
jgi:hypothetical protein